MPTRIARIRNTDNNKYVKNLECLCLWEGEMVQPLGKTAWQLHIELPSDSAVLFPALYPGEMQTYVRTETCPRGYS